MKVEVAELRLRIRQGVGDWGTKCEVSENSVMTAHKNMLRGRRLCLNKLGSFFLPIAVELDYISRWK